MANRNAHDENHPGGDVLPEDDPALEPVVREVCAWAGEEQELPGLDLNELRAMTRPNARPGLSILHPPRAAWILAAASILVYCVSLVSVRLEWGAAALELGRESRGGSEEDSVKRASDLEGRFNLKHAALETELLEIARKCAALESDFRETTQRLAQAQDVESETRYEDILRILKLTSSIQQESVLGQMNQ